MIVTASSFQNTAIYVIAISIFIWLISLALVIYYYDVDMAPFANYILDCAKEETMMQVIVDFVVGVTSTLGFIIIKLTQVEQVLGEHGENPIETPYPATNVHYTKSFSGENNSDSSCSGASNRNNNNNPDANMSDLAIPSNNNDERSVDTSDITMDSERQINDPDNTNKKRKFSESLDQEFHNNAGLYDKTMSDYNHPEIQEPDKKRKKPVEDCSIISSEIFSDDSEARVEEKLRLRAHDEYLRAEKVVYDTEMLEFEKQEQLELDALRMKEVERIEAEYKDNLKWTIERSKLEAIKAAEAAEAVETENSFPTKSTQKGESKSSSSNTVPNIEPTSSEAGPSNWYELAKKSSFKDFPDQESNNQESPTESSGPNTPGYNDSGSDPEFSTTNKGKGVDRRK